MERQETHHCISLRDETGVVVGCLVAICFRYKRDLSTPWCYRKESRNGVAGGKDKMLGISQTFIENKK